MKTSAMMLFMLVFHHIGISQMPNVANLQFNRMSIKDGLPADFVNCLLQDKEGYMWIGTQRGLVRYDGYKPKVYEFGLEELSKLNIFSMFEDRSGVLWIGTASNLYSYDRALDSFVHYDNNPKDARSISPGTVCAMHDDRNGNLWLLISDSLNWNCNYINSFDKKNKRFKRYDILGRGSRVTNQYGLLTFLEDSRGHIWFGTNDGAYEYIPDQDKFALHFAAADAGRKKSYGWPSEDAAYPGIIWMTVRDTKSNRLEGLVGYNSVNGSTRFYRHHPNDPNSLDTDSVYTIHKASAGRLFFGTENGLSVLEANSAGFINYPVKEPKIRPYDNQIWVFTEDSAHNIWCGNQFNLFLFNESRKRFFRYVPSEKDPQSLKAGTYNDLLTDHFGTVWVSTSLNGVGWLNNKRSQITVYRNNPGKAHHFPGGGGASSFAGDKDGTCWIWNSSGLYHWYPAVDSFERIKAMTRPREDGFFQSSSIVLGKNGTLWCNSDATGLYNYNPATGESRRLRLKEKDSVYPASIPISALFEDKKGILWIGTFGAGLWSLDQQTNLFKHYPYINNKFLTPNNGKLDDASVFTVFEDAGGTLWVGTLIGGLNEFNRESETFTSYQNQSPGFLTVVRIFEDSKGQLWVGTFNGGLFLFDRRTKKAKKLGEKDGLLYNGALGINEDDANNLWVTSPRGISIIDIDTKKISRFGVKNGLPKDPEYNFNLFKTKKGSFLLPFEEGFMAFDPGQLKADAGFPIVRIQSVRFRKPKTREQIEDDSLVYTYGKPKISLHYDENRITFDYLGITFQNSSLNQYQYQLSGYDKNWVQAGTQQYATYNNLLPGTYVFHLKAANSDGVWSPREQTLTVMILPPWWRTWWAYMLYAILFLALLRGYVLYRSRHLIRRNRVLEEKVVKRTFELNQSISELKAAQNQLIQSEKMASLGELTAGIAHEIQNPLNFVNNFSEINREMVDEATAEATIGNINELKKILHDIKANSEKITFHGNRADAIVKGMLQHSRQTTGAKEPTDINELCEEYLKLSYHGLRARDKTFNCDFETELDRSIGKVSINPQDMGRVLLNLFNNAFYAVNEKQKTLHPSADPNYKPLVSVRSEKRDDKLVILIEDNGNGIPKSVKEKIFQPFFTTKPAGQGTGLGLSLAYDIITKGHDGSLFADSIEGEGTTFKIYLNC